MVSVFENLRFSELKIFPCPLLVVTVVAAIVVLVIFNNQKKYFSGHPLPRILRNHSRNRLQRVLHITRHYNDFLCCNFGSWRCPSPIHLFLNVNRVILRVRQIHYMFTWPSPFLSIPVQSRICGSVPYLRPRHYIPHPLPPSTPRLIS